MRRTRNWLLAVAAAGIVGGSVLVAMGMSGDDPGGLAPIGTTKAGVPARPTTTASATPTGPTPQQLAALARQRRTKALDKALKAYAATAPEFSVAVLDRRTGQLYAYRGAEQYETASVVKVQVLACLLLTAQDDGRKLTSSEDARAKNMIRNSDNDATTSLFKQLGRSTAVGACNKRLGLVETKVSSSWGLTRTTVRDQVRLLDQLADARSPLSARSRAYAYELMSTVAADQDWGVPAAAKPGEKATVKNGWLSRSTEGGRYIINTVGRIVGPGTDVSIAVLSHGHQSEGSGHTVVEKVAKLTRTYLRY